MAMVLRGNVDDEVGELKRALDAYEADYPGAEASLYRQNSASIRLRIIDRRFEGMSKSRRHDMVLEFLRSRVSDDTLPDVSVVLAIAPGEAGSSLMNLEFNDPTPSRL